MKTTMVPLVTKSHFNLSAFVTYIFLLILSPLSSGYAQAVLFDFNTAPSQTSLPITITVNSITAHFSATANGFSIQQANTIGFTPPGFDGLIIYPNSVFPSDLLISFDQTLTDFSIMYSPQELGCDDSAKMRVTAYMNTTLIGTNTRTASNPGTWPVDTLGCSFVQGFNSVIVHYDSRPPTCQDYGPIFMADNMLVTPLNLSTVANEQVANGCVVFPNPVSQTTTLSFSLLEPDAVTVTLYSSNGRMIKTLFEGELSTGKHVITWDATDGIANGVYLLKLNGKHISKCLKLIVAK
jgi:hypothetical protein